VAWLLAVLGALCAVGLGALVGVLLGGVFLIVLPTRGRPIDPARRDTAVLVLDVQDDFTRDRPEIGGVIEAIDAWVGEAREAGVPVAYVRTAYATFATRLVARLLLGGVALAGSPGARLEGRLGHADVVFDKTVSDALSSDPLEAWLSERRVGRLVLIGLAGTGSLRHTARAARTRGYDVVTIESLLSLGTEPREVVRALLTDQGVRLCTAEEGLTDASRSARS
jgi:nicotinamidase-related amidase